ncbi:OLC1v1005082C1 [Oldenlandia corymbosa var. corymbosa]|uniref:OLC1v1005082C1 n=1 Tax=Oldenlandia corymbosa var. corymbosa TaxID=529605 RepID=A0AAV1DDU4_OLDCO|nr:OLC1v1005082C1 [Oldenlandia corymbosa var. corymbosa]
MVRDSEGKTVDDFQSTIDFVDKVENIRTRYDLPSDLEARAPLGNKRANSPLEERITVYDRFMHLGLRFSLFPLFEEIVQHYKTPLARFTPNLITFVLGFAKVCQHVKVKPRLILWRYFFQVVVASTSFQDWYIVKRCLRSGVKKMVESYGGSPEWKPDFLFARASKDYCLSWNHREMEGLGAIKDEWTQEDDKCIEELDADVEKILKYSKVMSSNNAGSRLFGDEDPFTIVNLDKDVTIIAAPQKKKKKRIVKAGDRAKYKKARTDTPSKETAAPDDETVPPATETVQNPRPEAGPSVVPLALEKGKGLFKGEAITLPPQLFEGGPSVAVHTFSNPPTIECPVLEEFAAQLNEADTLRLISAVSMAYLVQLRKLREDLVTARSERDEALFKVVTLEEKARQVQAKEAEIPLVQAKYDELDEKMKCFASLHISKEELHQWCVAFMYKMLSTWRDGRSPRGDEFGCHQILIKDPKKTMHEAMVKVLTRLNLEQLPLWEALTGALPKMSSPADIAPFPGDVPAILARGPSEEDPIHDVPDEYMSIELEYADEATEEDVADTGPSGVELNTPFFVFIEASLFLPYFNLMQISYNPILKQDSWLVHHVHLMVLSEEQSSEYPLYSMISRILRGRADVHSIETVANLENDLLDAMRTHNVKVNQDLINEIKELREEMQHQEAQSLKDYGDSLTFKAEIHDEPVILEKENTRSRRFIAAMDILKGKAHEIGLLTDYIAKFQNLLLDNNIDFEVFEHLEETVDPRTQSSREELFMRVHAQDLEIVDLKDKLNQCVNLLSLHGYKGIIHPSLNNPAREVLVIV